MKMQEMDDYLIEKGFDVKRLYDGVRKDYFFDIRKDGIGTTAYFKYEGQLSQERFLDQIIAKWENACDMYRSRTYDPRQLQRDLARYGDKAKLIVNENVYPIHITDLTIEHSANEVPNISVEGNLISFAPESRTCLYRPYTDGTEHIAVARGNGKSLLAMRQMYEMMVRSNPFAIEKVIFNGPATIVMWMDGTKTIVKCQDGDEFDPEKGLAMAISKKAFGNKGNYCDVFKKCLEDCNVHYETINTDPRAGDIYNAQQRLHNALHDTKATKRDLIAAMKEAVGYLDHTHIDQNYI